MTYAISDDFNDPRGRWNQTAPWDGTEHSDSAKGFLSTQTHVDLRVFRNLADVIPVAQTELEVVPQTTLDAEPQTSMETKLGFNTMAELWKILGAASTVTTSGSEITDATRAANVDGDGLSNDGSFGIWEATTNLCTNGGFETNLGTWTDEQSGSPGTVSQTRSTVRAKFGTASMAYSFVNTGTSGAGPISGSFASTAQAIPVTTGTNYTASAWVYVESTAGSTQGQIQIIWETAAGAVISRSFSTNTWTVGAWQRIFISAVAPANAAFAYIKVDSGTTTNVGQTFLFYIDGVQLEQKAYATPYKQTNGAAATRPAARVQAPASLLNATQGWIAAHIRMGFSSAVILGGGADAMVFSWGDSGANRYYVGWNPALGKFEAVRNGGGSGETARSATVAFNAGDLLKIVVAWTTAGLSISVGGAAFLTTTGSHVPTILASLFDVGAYIDGSQLFDSSIAWFSCGTGTLTDADAAWINEQLQTGVEPTLSDINTQNPNSMPTMVWNALTSADVVNTGFSDLPVVGKIATRGGWSGLQMTTNGNAVDCIFGSSISTPIDISAMTHLSMVFPDYNTFDTASTIELTSSVDGSFTDTTYKSPAVAMTGNISTMPEVRLPLTSFTTGAGVNFSLTKVTGIRFTITHTTGLPVSGSTFTLMAIRAITSAWTTAALDFDTRLGAVVVPVTLNGNVYTGTVASSFEFVRGDGTKSDPIPADTVVNLFFYPGGEVANDATGSNYNKLSTILREVKDSPDGTGSHLEVSLLFNATATNFEVKRVDSTGGSPGTTTNYGVCDASVGAALNTTQHYLFHVEVKGTQILASIYETDIARNVGNLVWTTTSTVSDLNYTYRNGRVGFIANFLTRDAYLDTIDVAPTGYASLTTQVFTQRTPVDGAQLAAVFADDENLWQSYAGTDVLIDQTKTISGSGSFRTSLGLTSNSFVVDDWTQTYLNVGIWVPSNVTTANQPIILLNTSTGTEKIVLPRLQPAQWNRLRLDLGIFRNLLSGVGYSFSILPATNPDKPLGNFWVDETVLGRRRVAWSVRATPNGPWRQFGELVNEPNGGVHFPANERGTDLQLKAEALTQDSWVSSFKIFPRHSELGLPVYDQAFATR